MAPVLLADVTLPEQTSLTVMQAYKQPCGKEGLSGVWRLVLLADVTSPEQVHDLMAAGYEQRAVGCHDINAHSSRSHCALIIHCACTNAASGVRARGKLTLCDLAGSERINKTGATGDAPYTCCASALPPGVVVVRTQVPSRHTISHVFPIVVLIPPLTPSILILSQHCRQHWMAPHAAACCRVACAEAAAAACRDSYFREWGKA